MSAWQTFWIVAGCVFVARFALQVVDNAIVNICKARIAVAQSASHTEKTPS